jgi:hypothetical protein
MKLIQAFFIIYGTAYLIDGSLPWMNSLEIANIAKIAGIAKIVRTDRLKPQRE